MIALGVAFVVGYAWIATGFRSFTLPSLVATLAGGLAAIGAGTRLSPSPDRAEQARAGAWRWAVLAVAAAVWQLQAFIQHPRSEHPTISSLTNTLLESHPSRAAAMAAWLAAGVWLARR